MKIHPELIPLIEAPRYDGLETVRQDFLKTCERLNLSIDHFDGEQAKEEVSALAKLHYNCYSDEYSPKDSLAYIQKCIRYNGFHAFSLTHGKEIIAATWLDDGKPYPDHVPLIIEEFTRQTGSNLVAYAVQIMTTPTARSQGLSKGLRLLMQDFCDTVYGADALLVHRIRDENNSSMGVAKGTGVHPIPYAATSSQPARYWSAPAANPFAPVAYSRRDQPSGSVREITHFPDHPARHYLGKVAVIHSYAPHRDIGRLLKNSPENPSHARQEIVYGFSDIQSFLAKDWSEDPHYRHGYNSLVHHGMTITDSSVIRSTVNWRNDQLYKIDAYMPRFFAGPDLAPSLIFSSLYVVAQEAAKTGHDVLTTKISSDDLLKLTRIIDATYPFRLTDFVEVGSHRLEVDGEALKNGSRNDMTTVYINTAKLAQELEKFTWIASAHQTSLGTNELYARKRVDLRDE